MPILKTKKSKAVTGSVDATAEISAGRIPQDSGQADIVRGFQEAPAAFDHHSLDDSRFSQSVELARCFSAIENDADRAKVLALARRLAHGERD